MKIFTAICVLFLSMAWANESQNQSRSPNIVIIFLDDSGWADFQPFGEDHYITPKVKKLAQEGTVFNQFYVPQAICSASRSALLSGSYPGRTRVFNAHGSNGRGLSTEFATIAEQLKKANYKTAHFGKWHCGDQDQTRPYNRGFDEHAGLMYSNDMWHLHPMNPKHWGKFPLRYWENGKIKIDNIQPEHQKLLTKWTTEKSVDFIKRSKDSPFFLYVAHPMPHVPLYVSQDFEGVSGRGLYGDVIAELDWSVGKINQALKDNGLEENTMVIFSSDNGPWKGYGNHAGKTPFREAKTTSFDGGVRSPLIVKYPKLLKANQSSEKVFCSIDFMPTILDLCGAPRPENPIDGKNVLPLLKNTKKAVNPHKFYFFTIGKYLEAVMTSNGRWKLHLAHTYKHIESTGKDGFDGGYSSQFQELALFDLKNDPKETKNLIDQYPELAEELKKAAAAHKQKFYSKAK